MSARLARSSTPDTYVVARVEDVPEGTRLIVDVAGRSIGVFRVDGRFYAVGNRCPHKGGELCKGQILRPVVAERPGDVRLGPGKLLVCPWHAWEFDLETGQSWCDARGPRMRTFPVAVETGAAVAADAASRSDAGPGTLVDAATHRVKGPYVADVFPVAIEDDYLVVSMRSARRA